MAEDTNARFMARPGQEIAGESFGEAFKRHKAAGRADFSWRGKTYSTKSAEEQGREIGARAAPGSGRGTAVGRTAADRDTSIARAESTARRAEIPTGGAAMAPASTDEGMSETTRNVLNTMNALGPGIGSGFGAAMRGARTLGNLARTAGTTWRDRPPAGADPSKWRDIVRQIDEAYPGTVAPPGGTTKEGLAKALAEDIGSASIPRGTPMRSTATTADTGRRFTPAEEMEAATSAARGAAGRRQVQEARTGRSQAAAEAKAEKPVLRTDKAKETPRSRTRETDEDVEFKRGGKTKAYAKGGSVKGAGCEQRGLRKFKVY